MIDTIFTELNFFKNSFSRTKTWIWFCIAVIAFMGTCDPLGGVSGLVRSLGLNGAVYGSLLGFFQSSAVNRPALQYNLFNWIRAKFMEFVVTIDGKELLILDAKKQAKSGKRMPGVKWHHQDSSSSSKKEYVTAHSFECLGIAINCLGCVTCLLFLVRMIDGFKSHNRDSKTLKQKVGDLILSNSAILAGRVVVCDAWYAAQQILIPAMEVSSTIITRVGKSAVACYEPIKTEKKRGRPLKYGKEFKLLSMFDSLDNSIGEVKNCSGEAKSVTYWSIELLWRPIKQKVLFVGSKDEKGRKIVLLCTDLKMDPLKVIQAYVYRSSIEHSFWLSTQFFSTWTYRFWTKLPVIKSDLKGNFNLHRSNSQLKECFHSKVQSYEIFLTVGFLAHAMFLFLGLNYKEGKIKDNIVFFRFRSRESGASVPIMRAMFVSEYHNFIRFGKSDTEQGKLLIQKYKECDLDRGFEEAA